MSFVVSLADDAIADLDRLHDWIEERANGSTADDYDRRIRMFIRTLADFPRRGSPHDEVASGLRSITFERRQVILYQVKDGTVDVLRVFDAHRDWPRLLG